MSSSVSKGICGRGEVWACSEAELGLRTPLHWEWGVGTGEVRMGGREQVFKCQLQWDLVLAVEDGAGRTAPLHPWLKHGLFSITGVMNSSAHRWTLPVSVSYLHPTKTLTKSQQVKLGHNNLEWVLRKKKKKKKRKGPSLKAWNNKTHRSGCKVRMKLDLLHMAFSHPLSLGLMSSFNFEKTTLMSPLRNIEMRAGAVTASPPRVFKTLDVTDWISPFLHFHGDWDPCTLWCHRFHHDYRSPFLPFHIAAGQT